MWFRSLFASLKHRPARAIGRPARRDPANRRPLCTRLRLEPLDDRCLLSFSPAVNYPFSGSPDHVVVADFNVDGILDQVAGNASYLGNGDGTFRYASWGVGVAVGDFNLDGRPDLIGGSVFLGNGDGTFVQGQDLGVLALTVAVGDLNNDGKPDLVITLAGTSPSEGDLLPAKLVTMLGNGDGTFTPRSYGDFPTLAAQTPLSLALADFNGDGCPDVVASSEVLTVFRGNGDGSFGMAADLPGYWFDNYAGAVAVGDFNRDSHADIVNTNFFTDEVYVYLGAGNGSFAGPVAYDAGVTLNSVAVTDVNGDDLLDVVTGSEGRWDGADYAGKGVSVLLGRGDGSFAAPQHYATSEPAWDVAAGDFNGDGYTDLTAAVGAVVENAWVDTAAAVLINDGIWTPPPPPPPPSMTINDVTVTEGNTGTRMASFTVTLSAASTEAVTVTYGTADGTATAGSEYAATSGTLTIPAGQTTGTITVLVKGDRLPEPNETFFVNISSPTNATIGDGQGMGTIVDDEPRISISDVTKSEGRKGQTTQFIFTVTLSAAYDQAVTMSFATANGTAKTSDGDYVAKTGTLTFAPGETTKTITIEVKGDSKKESNETFTLELFGASSNALLLDAFGLGLILNDD